MLVTISTSWPVGRAKLMSEMTTLGLWPSACFWCSSPGPDVDAPGMTPGVAAPGAGTVGSPMDPYERPSPQQVKRQTGSGAWQPLGTGTQLPSQPSPRKRGEGCEGPELHSLDFLLPSCWRLAAGALRTHSWLTGQPHPGPCQVAAPSLVLQWTPRNSPAPSQRPGVPSQTASSGHPGGALARGEAVSQ